MKFFIAFFAFLLVFGLSVTPVSAAKPVKLAKDKVLVSTGTVTQTVLSADGCQFTAEGCSMSLVGTAETSRLGMSQLNSSLTINWAQATSNGEGGYCAPATGTATLTAANRKGTVNLNVNGTVCEVGATAVNAAHTLTGTYTVTGGTGKFTSATGTGTLTGSDNGTGSASILLNGTITY